MGKYRTISRYSMLTETCTCARFRNNTTDSEGVNSERGGSKQFITWIAQAHLMEPNMHPAAKASLSKLCELGSLVLTSKVGDHGQEEE
jgi:hypothetical protein